MSSRDHVPEYLDITLPFSDRLPVWPTVERFRLSPDLRIADGKNANSSSVKFNLHTGTHIDAPWHFLADGGTIDELVLADLLGPVVVAAIHKKRRITAQDLQSLALPEDMVRLLLKTDNSQFWADSYDTFQPDFTALTPDAAEWIVERGIRLIGVDYLSVQCFHDPDDSTHQILLKEKIVIVEGVDLHLVDPGHYDLICLPMLIAKAEAAPARVLLRKIDS
jgi:arylformamidase